LLGSERQRTLARWLERHTGKGVDAGVELVERTELALEETGRRSGCERSKAVLELSAMQVAGARIGANAAGEIWHGRKQGQVSLAEARFAAARATCAGVAAAGR